MGVDIHFTNNIDSVKDNFKQACIRALEECGLTAEGYAKQACPVDTGELRNSISHEVVESEGTVYIGTNCEYGPYVELGTGIYATMGGGRSTPWVYQDAHGDWHMTQGQPAQPYLKPAVADHASTYNKLIEGELKNG